MFEFLRKTSGLDSAKELSLQRALTFTDRIEKKVAELEPHEFLDLTKYPRFYPGRGQAFLIEPTYLIPGGEVQTQYDEKTMLGMSLPAADAKRRVATTQLLGEYGLGQFVPECLLYQDAQSSDNLVLVTTNIYQDWQYFNADEFPPDRPPLFKKFRSHDPQKDQDYEEVLKIFINTLEQRKLATPREIWLFGISQLNFQTAQRRLILNVGDPRLLELTQVQQTAEFPQPTRRHQLAFPEFWNFADLA